MCSSVVTVVMIRRLSRSMSFRLLAIFLVMGALFAYGAILGIRWVYATDQLRELVSGHLSLHIGYVKNDIGNPPRIDNALEITEKVPVDIRISGPDMDWASDPAFPTPEQLEFGSTGVFSEGTEAWLRGVDGVQFASDGGHGFLKIDQGPYAIIVSTPKISDQAVVRHLTPIIMGFGLFLVLLAYLAVRWLFKPIGAIQHGAAEIGSGNFEYRITEVRRDQLGDLAEDINQMADDVQRMLDAKRQLLLGISHELRSPLSRLTLALALADDAPGIEGLKQDASEMERIITTLLEAERLNSRHAGLRLARISAAELAGSLTESFFSRDKERIKLDAPESLWLNVDEARATLMLKNLLSNALRYSGEEDGPVTLEFDTSDRAWIIRVRDHGPGIPEAQIQFIGEPFHRGDPSRTRNTGGSGLGLYLARLVAEAHGGTLALDRSWTRGACFVVTLPFEPRL